MITILGVKLSYEALAFLALFIGSEVVGSSKMKSNSLAQLFVAGVSVLKPVRKEDDQIKRIKDALK